MSVSATWCEPSMDAKVSLIASPGALRSTRSAIASAVHRPRRRSAPRRRSRRVHHRSHRISLRSPATCHSLCARRRKVAALVKANAPRPPEQRQQKRAECPPRPPATLSRSNAWRRAAGAAVMPPCATVRSSAFASCRQGRAESTRSPPRAGPRRRSRAHRHHRRAISRAGRVSCKAPERERAAGRRSVQVRRRVERRGWNDSE